MADPAPLLAGTQAGDRAAFESLIRSQSKRLYALACRVTGDSSMAEDVVQDTFLRILEGRSPLRQKGAAQAWLAQVTTRLALDQVRRRKARRSREEEHAMVQETRDEQPVERLMASEQAFLLSEALASLPVETRAALWLHVVEGSGLRDVAQCLGSTRSTVSRRIQSGLEQLREFLSRRGWVLPVTFPLGKLLLELPAPDPPPQLLVHLEKLGSCLAPGERASGGSAPGDKLGSKLPATSALVGAFLRGVRNPSFALPIAALVLVVSLGLSVWILDPFGGRAKQNIPRSDGKASAVVSAARQEPKKGSQDNTKVAVEEPKSPFQVRGRVVDEKGQPAVGAEVLAYEDFARRDVHDLLDQWGFVDLSGEILRGSALLGKATTAAEGLFAVPLSKKPDLVIYAVQGVGCSEEGSSPCSGTTRVTAEEDWAEISLKPGTRVSGTVLDLNGSPLEGAQLVVIPDPAMPNDRDFTSFDFKTLLDRLIPIGALTDEAGRFEFPSLPFDKKAACQIVAIREGYAAEHARVDLSSSDAVELALLPAAKIPGKVTRSPGVPAAGARILALESLSMDRGWFAAGVADEGGEFALDGSLEGGFEVFAKLPGYVRPRKIHWQEDRDSLPLKIQFEGDGVIKGRVRFGKTGQPATGVRILCRDREGALTSAEAVTQDDGSYVLSGVPLDFNYDIFVALAGYIPRDLLANPPTPEEREARYDIDLVPTAIARGTVIGPTGSGVPNALVEVMATAETQREGVNLRLRTEILAKEPLKTDESGAFVAEDVVPRGKVFVWAYDAVLGEAFTGPVTFSEGEPSVAEVTVQLQGAGLEVRVTDTLGQLLDAIEVRALSETVWSWVPKGMALKDWYNERTSMDLSRYGLQLKMVPGSRMCVQGKDSPCTWTDLTAAPYVVAMSHEFIPGDPPAWDAEYWLYMGTTEALSAHQVLRLRLPIDLSRSFVGHVSSKDGKIIPPIRVQVWYTADPIPGLTNVRGYSVTHSRKDGSFKAESVGPGPYRITVQDRANRVIEVKDVPEGKEDLTIVYAPEEGQKK